jgi:hypothetical protein
VLRIKSRDNGRRFLLAGPAAEPDVSIRATIIAPGRFGIAAGEAVKKAEKHRAAYREANGLDLHGKPTAVANTRTSPLRALTCPPYSPVTPPNVDQDYFRVARHPFSIRPAMRLCRPLRKRTRTRAGREAHRSQFHGSRIGDIARHMRSGAWRATCPAAPS